MDYREFFINSVSEVESNFINLCKVTAHISSSRVNPQKRLYLGLKRRGNSDSSRLLSNVTIDQYDDNGSVKHIAYFYNHYQYTKGLGILLSNCDNTSLYRLYLELDSHENDRFDINIHLFIDKPHLLQLYQTKNIPPIVYQIMIDCKNGKNIANQDLDIIGAPTSTSTYEVSGLYKRNLFNYQKENTKWLVSLEKSILSPHNTINTFKMRSSYDYRQFKIQEIDEFFIINTRNQKLVDESELEAVSINLKGGVLADEIGLGKTYSMISLLVERQTTDTLTSLIICPRRLCIQWRDEIEMSCNLKVKVIASITQFKKLNYDNINDYDVLIISYQFLTNQNYEKYAEENPSNLLISNYVWERVILDEGHEYINVGRNMKKMHYRDTKESLFKIKSNYRWICSGTPYSSKKDIEEILTYLSNFNGAIKLKGIKHILPSVISRYFRKNTKETVNNEVNIPQPQVDTEFLSMTTIERALYDSALGNRDKMIEYCNHIMVSDENVSILGNKPLPLDQIHSKMTEHYSKKIIRQEKRLEIIQNELQNIENTDENSLNSKLDIADQINSELRDNKRKLEIFQGLSSKLEEEECPVCYEKLKDLVKAITPWLGM